MQQQFVIQTVETSLIDKKIIVTTNNNIDPNSLDDIFIQIMERETRSEVMFTKEIKGQVLEVTLNEWPIPNTAYIFYLKSLTNVLGEPVRSGVRRKIQFDSAITKKVEIISPSMHETVKSLDIKFDLVDVTDIEDKNECYAYLEIATDNEFYNVVKSTKVKEKNSITITNLKEGQYYLRARAESDEKEFQYGIWSETISFIYGKPVCVDADKEEDTEADYIPDFEDMTVAPEIDDVADFEVSDILCPEGTTPDGVLRLLLTKNIDEDKFNRFQIYITRKEFRTSEPVNHSSVVSENMIEIIPDEGFKDNSIYEIRLLNIESVSGDSINTTVKFITRMKPMYVDSYAVSALIGDYKIPNDVILYHIKEASKFADYIISHSDYPFEIDENDVPFPVSQFVKYFAAHECLLRHTVDLSSSTGVSGTVGDVTFSEKESVKDISKLLKHFCDEIDKWKEALKGYDLEGRAHMRTGVRGRYSSPPMESLYLNNDVTFGRGNLYGGR